MSKVKNPLFSTEARGSLGKTLTYGTWHNVDIVKLHSSPANPNTAAQQEQRGFYGQAIYYFRLGCKGPYDLDALRRWARVLGGKMSYYNAYMKETINDLKDGNFWFLHTCTVFGLTVDKEMYGQIIKMDPATDGIIKWGFCPRGLVHSKVIPNGPGKFDFTTDPLPDGVNVYFQIMLADGSNRTGIYMYKVEY